MNSFIKDNELMLEAYNLTSLALDAWWKAIPDDPYAPCPCGCGEKFKFVSKDDSTLEVHEKKFIDEWIKTYNETNLKIK
jgi:hypothetical protein